MGLLVVGTPFTWEESLKYLDYVRRHGIAQFIATYKSLFSLSNDALLWGDEIEYSILKMCDDGTVKLSLRATAIREALSQKEESLGRSDDTGGGVTWHPEYGSWMVEATPKRAYGGYTSDLLTVEANMRLRRRRILTELDSNEMALTVTAFPMMGVGSFTSPASQPGGPAAASQFVSDALINPHPRFAALTANIRARRGSNVDIRVPLFRDSNTPEFAHMPHTEEGRGRRGHRGAGQPVCAKNSNGSTAGHGGTGSDSGSGGSSSSSSNSSTADPSAAGAVAGSGAGVAGAGGGAGCGGEGEGAGDCGPWPSIHMDAMAFGMGACCLQVTFQARDVAESRHLYDQLAVMAPIMLALTAASPIWRGRLADTDVRWSVIAQSVDDRTPEERGEREPTAEVRASRAEYVGGGVSRVYKSRYDSISAYICNCSEGENPHRQTHKYNDVEVAVDPSAYEQLRAAGVDEVLCRHIAHLFARDPLVIFAGRVSELDDSKETDHFENLQSTNWQTVRWKPPPPAAEGKPHIGWRTEFRSMELQLTDFENAAFTVFTVLMSRVILSFDLNLYVPLSKVDANMETAHRRDAVLREKFFFRKHMAKPSDTDCNKSEGAEACSVHRDKDGFEEMTVFEILTGKGHYFPGLIPLIYAYLDTIGCDSETREKVSRYLRFIIQRASGELMTTAAWMRNFVTNHPEYQHDSVVSHSVAADLLKTCSDIGLGAHDEPDLLGDITIEQISARDAYPVPLISQKLGYCKQNELIARYTHRCSFLERKMKERAQRNRGGGGGGGKRGGARAPSPALYHHHEPWSKKPRVDNNGGEEGGGGVGAAAAEANENN